MGWIAGAGYLLFSFSFFFDWDCISIEYSFARFDTRLV